MGRHSPNTFSLLQWSKYNCQLKIKVLWFSVCIAAVSLGEWKLNPRDTQEPGWQTLWLPAKQESAFADNRAM